MEGRQATCREAPSSGTVSLPVSVLFEVPDEAARGRDGTLLVKIRFMPRDAQQPAASIVAQTAEIMRAKFRTMGQDSETDGPALLNA